MDYIKTRYARIAGEEVAISTERIPEELLEMVLKINKYQKEGSTWTRRINATDRVVIAREAASSKPGQTNQTSRTHYINTKWWMGDLE